MGQTSRLNASIVMHIIDTNSAVCGNGNQQIEPWYDTEEYRGEVRKITFRSLCSNPMCPPDTAVTEYQHGHLSDDKKFLVSKHYLAHFTVMRNTYSFHFFNGKLCHRMCSRYLSVFPPLGIPYRFDFGCGLQTVESVQQCHDIPFGSYFEVLSFRKM